MPICPIPVGVEPGGNYREWSILRHLVSPFPIAYIIDPKDNLLAAPPREKWVRLDFYGLGSIRFYSNHSSEISHSTNREANGAAMTALLHTGEPGKRPLVERSMDLVVAAIHTATFHYARHGFGRTQPVLQHRLFGSDPTADLRELIHHLPPDPNPTERIPDASY